MIDFENTYQEENPNYQPFDKVPTYINKDDEISANPDIYDNKWISKKNRKYSFEHTYSISVFDVAAYILKKLGNMTTMKLQKLIYYCQAWSLVWDEKPLYKEDIEAWANGPVVRELFAYHKGQFEVSKILIGNPDCLENYQKDSIDSVLDFYGNKSAQWLIDLAHKEKPWKITREGLNELQRGNKVIKLDVIADYYSSLLTQE